LVLEEIPSREMLDAAESFWTLQGRGLGWRLTNSRTGGPEGQVPPNRIPLDVPALLARYDAGESVLSLARALGVSRLVVTRRLEENGVTPRSGSEANRLRFARATPEERKAIASAAQAALRGQRYRRGPDGKRLRP
jgi:hypothetical protein